MDNKKITFGGRSFDVAPYPIGASRKLSGLLDKVQTGSGEGTYFDSILDFVKCGLQHTDPSLTDEQFEGLHTTLEEAHDAFNIVSEQAGFKKVAKGTGDAPLAPPTPSTGTNS